MKRPTIVAAAVLAILLLLWPALHPAAATNEVPPKPLTDLKPFGLSPGRLIYERYCLFCHGANGKGDGMNAYALPVTPTDLTTVGKLATEEKERRIVIRGGAATDRSPAMPAFDKTLSPRELELLFDWMREIFFKQTDPE